MISIHLQSCVPNITKVRAHLWKLLWKHEQHLLLFGHGVESGYSAVVIMVLLMLYIYICICAVCAGDKVSTQHRYGSSPTIHCCIFLLALHTCI